MPANELDRIRLSLRVRAMADVGYRLSFREFVAQQTPQLLGYEHAERLISVAQRIADGALKRVIICMPPRYWKTHIFGRLLPAYVLRRLPRLRCAILSHNADLAWKTSGEARAYYQQSGGKLHRSSSAKKHWQTEATGELWAAGVAAGILGFGFDLAIVDDPQDPDKAHSPRYQKSIREWWPAHFLSRANPAASIVLVQQRLGVDDVVDWLFRREVGDEVERGTEHWHVVICDEIKSDHPLGRYDGPMGLPHTCTLEPDPREVGEYLAPSYFPPHEVEHKHATRTEYVRSAQLQQRPAQPKGDFWRDEWFRKYDELPYEAHNGGTDWDTAYTDNDANSATAWCRSFRGPGRPQEFPIYIEDVGWEWLEMPELVPSIRAQHPPHYIEKKASGKSAAQMLRREGVVVSEVAVMGSKFERASGVQPVVAAGRVYLRSRPRPGEDPADTPWARLRLGERQGLLRVTAERLLAGGPDLDLNDVFVQAITRQTKGVLTGGHLAPGALTAPPARKHWAVVE